MVVGLSAKGDAVSDRTGFVVDTASSAQLGKQSVLDGIPSEVLDLFYALADADGEVLFSRVAEEFSATGVTDLVNAGQLVAKGDYVALATV